MKDMLPEEHLHSPYRWIADRWTTELEDIHKLWWTDDGIHLYECVAVGSWEKI
jgi:Zn ribbon nucleic-acid-binding protein